MFGNNISSRRKLTIILNLCLSKKLTSIIKWNRLSRRELSSKQLWYVWLVLKILLRKFSPREPKCLNGVAVGDRDGQHLWENYMIPSENDFKNALSRFHLMIIINSLESWRLRIIINFLQEDMLLASNVGQFFQTLSRTKNSGMLHLPKDYQNEWTNSLRNSLPWSPAALTSLSPNVECWNPQPSFLYP